MKVFSWIIFLGSLIGMFACIFLIKGSEVDLDLPGYPFAYRTTSLAILFLAGTILGWILVVVSHIKKGEF